MKKVLSLVLAAAMTLGIAATSFAAMDEKIEDTNLLTMDVTKSDGTTWNVIGEPVGTTAVSVLTPGSWEIPAGKTKEFKFHVVAVANEKDAKGDVINYNHWNFIPDVTVKGPATVSKEEIDKTTFRWYTANDKTYLSFDVKFTLQATNTDAVDYKGLVVKYGVKAQNVSNRSGLKSGYNTNKDIAAGYNNQDIEDLYDEVVNAFDAMRQYDETNFDVALKSNPVIPSSIVRFLARNLGSKETATFVMDEDLMTSYNDENATTYFNGITTLTFDKKAFEALNNGKHVNVAVNGNAGPWADILEEADFDYTVFNFVVHRDVTATISKEIDWNNDNLHVYLLNDDLSMPEEVKVNDTDDYNYGDVSFTGPMGRYLITYEEVDFEGWGDDEPGDNEPIEDDDNGLVDEDGNPIENNPGTGSSNAISLAVAMAVVSLAAAGLVASKKASK